MIIGSIHCLQAYFHRFFVVIVVLCCFALFPHDPIMPVGRTERVQWMVLAYISWPGNFIYSVVYWLFCGRCSLAGINIQYRVLYISSPFSCAYPQASSLDLLDLPLSPSRPLVNQTEFFHWPWISICSYFRPLSFHTKLMIRYTSPKLCPLKILLTAIFQDYS